MKRSRTVLPNSQNVGCMIMYKLLKDRNVPKKANVILFLEMNAGL